MSTCIICGRPLSNPASVAAGIGPVCGGRRYMSRVRARYTGSAGWTTPEAWMKANHPCFKCRAFEFPGKDHEKTGRDGCHSVAMHGAEQSFAPDAIGGYCKRLRRLVDGNLINEARACGGAMYAARPDNNAVKGVLSHEKGQILFDFETGLAQHLPKGKQPDIFTEN